jgi:hypothetical protein
MSAVQSAGNVNRRITHGRVLKVTLRCAAPQNVGVNFTSQTSQTRLSNRASILWEDISCEKVPTPRGAILGISITPLLQPPMQL